MSALEEQTEYQRQSIEYLRKEVSRLTTENIRLNDELRVIKVVTSNSKLSDPAFYRPISELEKDFEIIESKMNK